MSRLKADDNVEQMVAVENIKKETLVKRKPDANKVYKLLGYCRINKKYELQDWDDISRCLYVKKGTELFIGFEF